MQPNILLITTHDTGRHYGCYGRPVTSPAIDNFAAQGVRFDNYFCAAPQCSPSRASITTGRYPHRTGVIGLCRHPHFHAQMNDDVPTMAKCLANAGWSTHLWGFQHEHPDAGAIGYQHQHTGREHAAENVTPQLCRWLEERPSGPFFASVGYFETHIPFHRSPATAAEFAGNPLPFLPDLPALRRDVAGLNASVAVVDRSMAAILATLESSGLAENTIVILTTDHGIPFPTAKCSLYDAGLETALMIRWPGRIAQNRVVSEMLSNVDLMPTLLSLVGVPVPDGVDGIEFGGLLTGGHFEPREEIFAEMTYHDEYRPMRCIRTNRHKLIHHFEPRLAVNTAPKDFWECQAGASRLRQFFDYCPPEYQLFDLAVDPYEQHDLLNTKANNHAAPIFENLKLKLEKWMTDTDDPLRNGPVALA